MYIHFSQNLLSVFKVNEKKKIILQVAAWTPSLRTYGLSDVLSEEVIWWVIQKHLFVFWKLEDRRFSAHLPLGPLLDR